MPTSAKRLPKQLATFDEVVEALGGKREVARICDQDTAAVCNWQRRRGKFPTRYFWVMKGELDARGVDAPLDLWGFVTK